MHSSFKEIVDDIVSRHHSLLRRELPRITEQLDKLSVECPNNESLGEAQKLYKKVRTKIEAHLKDEESILFPIGISLDSGEAAPQSDMNLLERLREMETEHDGCSNALLTACQMIDKVPHSDLRDQLLSTIQLVQHDLLLHVEKENTLVHPRLIELLSLQELTQ